jgi:hypothetical protein
MLVVDRLGFIFATDSVACGTRFEAKPAPEKGKRAGRVLTQCTVRPNGTNRKQLYGTKACDESSLTAACYLCNTHPKTGGLPPFEAVPLLRVQKCSVIVMLRRRGASRGRPVRWFA